MRLKSIIKYFFLAFAGLITLILLAIVLFILFFPVNTVREMAVDELTTLLQRPVSIAHAEIRLFSGIELQQIQVAETPRFHQLNRPDSTALLVIQNAILKYQFWPLLKRQLVIDDILIDTPHICLLRDSTATWNFDLLLAALADSTAPPADTAVTRLPISIQLEKFEIRDLKLSMALKDDSTVLTLELANLTGKIFDLQIPRATPDEVLEQLKARIRLEMTDANLNLCYQAPCDSLNLNFTTKIHLAVDVAVNGFSRTEVSARLSLFQSLLTEPAANAPVLFDSPKMIPELLRIEFLGQADLLQENYQLSLLKLYIINELLLQGRGEFRQISRQPQLRFQIDESSISLSAVKSFLGQLRLKSTQALLKEIEWGGRLSLAGSQVAGNPLAETGADGLRFNSVLRLDAAHFNYLPNLARVEGIAAKLAFSGNYSLAGFEGLQTQGELLIPVWQIAPNDTFSLQGQDLELKINANLTGDFFPEWADVMLTAPKVQDAHVSLKLDWRSDGTWKNSQMNGALELENILLQNFDLPELAGRGAARLSVNATSLDSIQLHLTGQLDSLFFLYADDWEPVGTQNFSGEFSVKTDSLFLDFFVNPMALHVNDFLQLSGSVELINLGEDYFALNLAEAKIDNRKILTELPAVITETLGNFDLSGETFLSAQITGALPAETEPVFQGRARIKTRNMHVDLPDYYFLARNIQINSEVLFFTDSLTATVQATIDSFFLTDLRRQPFRNTWLKADLRMPDFSRVLIPACSVGVPEIAAKAWITGTVDNLATEPVTNLDTRIQIEAPTQVEIIDDILLTGRVGATNRLHFFGDILAINGEIQFDSLNLEVVETLTASGITGKTTVNQKVDLYRLCLLQEELPLFATRHFADLAYHYLRPFYRNQILPIQSVHIEKIKMLDYELSDIFLDVLFGGAKLQIPDFILNAYEGNVRGHLGIDFGEGTFEFPDSLLKTIQFDLKATASSINTAKLNPVISAKAKKSIINANVELAGAGLSPEGDLVVNGYFHITEIGSKVADNLLRSLDPMEADQGIQSVRSLLKFGYQPKLMSFEIRHGHFYPRIVLSKPFYIPINIAGGVVELARIPTEIFLKQALASPYYTE
jgi:hypothetical protein